MMYSHSQLSTMVDLLATRMRAGNLDVEMTTIFARQARQLARMATANEKVMKLAKRWAATGKRG